MSKQEKKSLKAFQGTVHGKIVWSTSRANSRHDIWIMNADGTEQRPLTDSPESVDWFSRFSPDGIKVLFTRSKVGWVSEMDADINSKWDLWIINSDGSGERKIVENATWGTWRPSGDSIVFSRGPKVYIKALDGEETEIFDAGAVFGKKNVYSQQPQLSPNGKLLAMTVRGTVRETGIYNRATNQWHTTGKGCQLTWFPDGDRVIRMNEGQGNMGTEVLCLTVNENGQPQERVSGISIPKKIRFMDLPGRRSHEYFPQIDNTGEWMVWAATQYGHEHDIVDYEIFIWNVNTNKKTDFVRLTFHSGNDRWPDLHTEEKISEDKSLSRKAKTSISDRPDTLIPNNDTARLMRK
ncbi:MAG: TolB family protein [Chitinivibrionales bacterium]